MLPGLWLLIAACAQPPAHDEWTLAAEEVRRIGDDPVDARTAFFRPSALGFDAAGRLHVLDSGNHRVQIFDADGRWVASRGRAGDGPGDLQQPEGMWVYPGGEILVADTGNRRLQGFGADGLATDPIIVDYAPLDVVASAERTYVLRLPPASFMFGPEALPLVQILDRRGVAIADAVEPERHDIGFLYFLLNTRHIAAAPTGGFALAHSHVVSRLRLFGVAGEPVSDIDTLYKADTWAPLGRLPRQLNDDSLGRIARTASALAWDPVRSLFWIVAGYVDRTAEGGWITGTELYRYDAEGGYRGTIPLPYRAIDVASAPDRTLWLLDIDGVVHQIRLHDPDRAGG